MKLSAGLLIARIRGIDIRIHWSWVLIAALLVWSLAEGVFGTYQGWSVGARWAAAVLATALFFASVLLHELAHSLVAQRYGVRVSSITLFIFGGVSSIAEEMHSAGQEFRVAIAGPLMSWLLGVVFGVIALATLSLGVAPIFGYLALINFALGVFNLLPGFPLDGGRVLRSLLWARMHSQHRATMIASRAGATIGIAMIVIGALNAIFLGFLAGAWYVLIGFFLFGASRGAAATFLVDELLEGMTARMLMRSPAPKVDASATLEDLAETQRQRGERAEIVEGERGPIGVVSVTDVARHDSSTWSDVRVEQVMVPAGRMVTVDARSSVRDALQLMAERGIHQLPVVSEGRVIGMLAGADVQRYLRTRMELAHAGGEPRRPVPAVDDHPSASNRESGRDR